MRKTWAAQLPGGVGILFKTESKCSFEGVQDARNGVMSSSDAGTVGMTRLKNCVEVCNLQR